jgi:hypothetical protein
VLLAVTSIVAAVVFTTMAGTHPNWRFYYEQQREAYEGLAAENQQLKASRNDAAQKLNDERAAHAKTKSDADLTIGNQKAEITNLKVQLTQKDNSTSLLTDKISALETNLKTQLDINNALRDDLGALRLENNKKQEEIISLRDLLTEATARAERLDKNLRVVQRQNEDLGNQLVENNKLLAEYKRRLPDMAVGEGEPLPPATKITGTVTAVSDNLASVNVGSAHGVKAGMKMILFRGDQFVGHLKIEQVRVNESAGIVMNKQLDPMQGDRVTSDLD